MEDLTFDKKHRVKNIKRILGNDSIKEYISNVEKWPSSILLVGETGCGKTTIARIIGKIRKSELIELNISKTRGIENARAIIDSVQTHSLLGTGKTIVLNECHEATKQFQDAMLEILEEPPKDVLFVLCTTDPQKLLPAVKSRCVIHKLNKLDYGESKTLLKRIIKKEKLTIDKSLYRDIILSSNGIPRKLLLILDSISNMKSKKQIKKIIEGYEYIDEMVSKELVELCQLLLRREKYKTICDLLKQIKEPPETIKRAICGYMSKILISGKMNENALAIGEYFYHCKTLEIGMPAIILTIASIYSD